MSQLRYWLWLTSLRGLRPISMQRLCRHFGGPMEVYFAPYEGYDAVTELTDREKTLLQNKDLTAAEGIFDICREKGIQILTMQDAAYPERLRQIADPPPVLFVRGQIPFLDELPAIALVGTRKATPYGVKMALKLGQEIAASGGCVVTGMAPGIDGAAARGALQAGGQCVGVLGTAIDVDYPAANASLIRDVAAVGSIISEFPPGYPTMGENFPRRNRIISGLSCGTCIIEAPERSGALITADLTLEQGRDLFAVPGNADAPNSAGCNRLIGECAKPVCCGWDILSEYSGLFSAVKNREISPSPEKSPPAKPDASTKTEIDKPSPIPYIDVESRLAAYSEEQQQLLRCLVKNEAHVDTLIASTGMSPARVLADMTILTIRGAVKALPGKRYKLNLS